MNTLVDNLHQTPIVSTIVIGRNEGKRLKQAFESLASTSMSVLYVDSGSVDGSVDLARSMNIHIHELNPREPFSAGRARREGVEVQIDALPELEFIQFLDGDCVLEQNWIEKAISHLIAEPDVGIVCGLLSEKSPERSIYNRMNALRWNAAPQGDIDTCGGIFMIRRNAYESVGGFNTSLLTGEESDLCSRVRAAGYRIVRLNEKMARHDSNMTRFSQWWKRAVWGGFGDALEYDVLEGKVAPSRRKETRSVYVWAVCLPIIGLIGIIGMIRSPWFMSVPLVCLLGYLALVTKIMRGRLQAGDAYYDAALYAALCVIRKMPYAIGFVRYRMNPRSIDRRPDPHAVKSSGTAISQLNKDM